MTGLTTSVAALGLVTASLTRRQLLKSACGPCDDRARLDALAARTREFATVWALACGVSIAGTAVACCWSMMGSGLAIAASVLMLLTPPKIASDADGR